MKTQRFLATLCPLVLTLCLTGCRPETDVVEPAPPAPEPVQHVLLGADGLKCEIVVPADAPALTRFAGRELQQFLSQALGRDVPVRDEPSGETSTAIILGDHPALAALGIDVSAIPQDGFAIRSDGSNLHIAGMDDDHPNVDRAIASSAWHLRRQHPQRGTLNGVYEFLERHVGVRFYFPGRYGTIVPRHTELALPAIDLVISPDHPARSMGYSGTLYEGWDEEDLPGTNEDARAWAYRTLDILRLRMQTSYVPHCHGLREFGYITRFGESNPEYFALMSNGRRHNDKGLPHAGHLCFSSGIRDEIFKDAKAFLSGEPAESRGVNPRGRGQIAWPATASQPGYVDLMPQDGFYPCNCEDCQVHFQGTRFGDMNFESASAFLWDFFIEVAERLQEAGVPGNVTTMAYTPYRHIPERDIPDNLVVSLCPAGPDAARDFDRVMDHIRGWHEKVNQRPLWLWINIGKYGRLDLPGVPFVVPRATGRYFKAAAPYINGAYFSLSMGRHEYLNKYINAYVANKIMWDNDTDVDALLDEHYRVMFGPAAEVMDRIYARFEKNWIERIRGNTVETELGETAVPPTEYQLWNSIYSPDEIALLDGWFDEAEALAAESPEHLERIRFMRRNLYGPLLEARAAYEETVSGISDWQAHVPTLEPGESITLDGRTGEAAWDRAEPLFLTPMGADREVTARTTVRVLRDEDHLYIFALCEEPHMDRIVATALERDAPDIFRESVFEVFINPTGDRTHYVQWVVNAAGSLTDMRGVKRGQSQDLDRGWQSGARVAVDRRDLAWTVEMAIPLADLGPLAPEGFPVNFSRNRVITGQRATQYTWSPYLRRSFHEIENFGTLRFEPSASKNMLRTGDFSAGATNRLIRGGWSISRRDGAGAQWSLDPDRFIRGGASLRLEGFGTGDSIAIRQNLPGLEPNREYRIAYHIRTEDIQPTHRSGGALISIWDERNNYYPINPYVGSMPWTAQGFTFRTSAKANTGPTSYIALILREATGRAWFDHVQVIPIVQ